MPTFHSVPLHPTIQQRLQQNNVPIVTPRALLTRNPTVLAEALLPATAASTTTKRDHDLTQIHQLRSQVALSMIQNTTITGKCQQQRQIRRRITQQDEQAAKTESTTMNITTTNDNTQKNVSTPKWRIPGVTISAWEQWQDCRTGSTSTTTTTTTTTTNTGSSNLYLQNYTAIPAGLLTACSALDDVMAFPDEWHMESGIPRGHVVSFVGPPGTGKTQLALQCALQQASLFLQASSTATTTTNSATATTMPGVVRYLASSAGHGSLRALAERCQSMRVAEQEEQETENCHSAFARRGINSSSNNSNNNNNNNKRRRHQRQTRRQSSPCLVPSNLYFQNVGTTTDLALILSQIEDEFMNTDSLDQQSLNTTATSSSSSSSYCQMIVVDALSNLICHAHDNPDVALEQALQTLKRLARLHQLWIVLVGGGGGGGGTATTKKVVTQLFRHYSDVQLSFSSSSSSLSFNIAAAGLPLKVKVQLTKHIGKVVETTEHTSSSNNYHHRASNNTTNDVMNDVTNDATTMTKPRRGTSIKSSPHSVQLISTAKGLQEYQQPFVH